MRHVARDYAQTPVNIYWEMTQACALACRHCRASAMPDAQPGELTHQESLDFLRQIPAFGDPLPTLILTGGDPLKRPDLFALIDEARRLGIDVSITPAATPAFTRDMLVDLQDHGVTALGLSLDGSTPERHDGIRGIPGTFDRTMEAIGWAAELGKPLQVNTLVTAETAPDIPAVYELLRPLGLARWSLFFLIEVGRGTVLEPLAPADGEEFMRWVYRTSLEAPFVVATTEAPSYRRVAIEVMREEGLTPEEIRHSSTARSFGVRDGHGIMFVSHLGEICPAGFLPLPVGNVRTDSLVEVYRGEPLFRSLHDPREFGGRCHHCQYQQQCGGSRARAYSAFGDPLAEDPFCTYVPPGYEKATTRADAGAGTPAQAGISVQEAR
ncbi:TIGR04053 family radical SAM/SPASM domain-containing protein [Demequina sp. TTPB684]|uniref:TIGR04053 family radical SAM/SPASM domain-containing protein n=1 Tax=unclassified Demequina TaxID=2620311 RepID=UPI001CF1033D|nr:TIGR04053 family radical SAM/SPASM domain-containing protein [Demequina sp. TMPB413]MCB2411596.1 TIGR04053 family radical SAM/SPASM domain-containing protein [Demequina sp. TTPB684]UPU89061.1 TIGR04053 family radical SAM/SPASM domain-containing protein [Demequina sp. TMPB413]